MIRQDTAGYGRTRQDTARYGRIRRIRQDTAGYGRYGRIRQDKFFVSKKKQIATCFRSLVIFHPVPACPLCRFCLD